MKILELQILAIIQGLTEFLPVSSSGHLALLQRLFGIEESQFGPLLEVLLHAATLLSVLIFFRKRLKVLLTGLLRRDRESLRLGGVLLLSAVPAGVFYALAHDAIESAFSSYKVIGWLLGVTAVILLSLKFLPRPPQNQCDMPIHPTWKQSLLIGVAQAIAILPGVSRSGSTYTMARWLKISPQEAFDFSFLMSIPVIGGAILLKMRHFAVLTSDLPLWSLLCAIVIAASVGYMSLVMLALIRVAGKMHLFAYWCFALFILTLFI